MLVALLFHAALSRLHLQLCRSSWPYVSAGCIDPACACSQLALSHDACALSVPGSPSGISMLAYIAAAL